jgi:hypothetical protein
MRKAYLFSGLLGLVALFAIGSSQAIMIDFVPTSPLMVSNGDTVVVDVVVSDLGSESVSAFDLDVSYDTTFLSATGVIFGWGLGNPFFFEVFESSDLSTPGIVDIAAVSLLSDAELDALQGPSVTLASLEFAAVGSGLTALDFVWGPGQDIKGRDNQQIYPTPVPEPSTVFLLVAGLLAVRWVGQKQRV